MDMGDMRPDLYSRLQDLKKGLADMMLGSSSTPRNEKACRKRIQRLQEHLIELAAVASDRALRLAEELSMAKYGSSAPDNESLFDGLLDDLRRYEEAFFAPTHAPHLLVLKRQLSERMSKFGRGR